MPTKKRALDAMAHTKSEIAELVTHYRELLIGLQQACPHTLVCSYFPCEDRHCKHPIRTGHAYAEHRICPTCGKEEKIMHGASIVRDLDHEGHDRVFPKMKYGPFREISKDVYHEIRDRFSPFPEEV